MELSNQIYKEFLEKSYDIVKSNPYSLIGVIKGVGFSKADEIALRLGEEKIVGEGLKRPLNIFFLVLLQDRKIHLFLKMN